MRSKLTIFSLARLWEQLYTTCKVQSVRAVVLPTKSGESQVAYLKQIIWLRGHKRGVVGWRRGYPWQYNRRLMDNCSRLAFGKPPRTQTPQGPIILANLWSPGAPWHAKVNIHPAREMRTGRRNTHLSISGLSGPNQGWGGATLKQRPRRTALPKQCKSKHKGLPFTCQTRPQFPGSVFFPQPDETYLFMLTSMITKHLCLPSPLPDCCWQHLLAAFVLPAVTKHSLVTFTIRICAGCLFSSSLVGWHDYFRQKKKKG